MARLRGTALSLGINGLGASVGQVIEVASVLLLTARLSSTDVATYFLVLQGVRIVYILESGMGQDLTRSLTGTNKNHTEYGYRALKSAATWYSMLFLISVVLVGASTGVFHLTGTTVNPTLVAFVGLGASAKIVTDGCFRALSGLMKLIQLRMLSLLRTISLLLVAATLASRGAAPFGLGVLLVEFVISLLGVLLLRTRLRGSWSFTCYSRTEFRRVVEPMTKANVTSFLSNRIDGFLVGAIVGTSGVVIHGLLLRIYDVARGGIELLLTGVIQGSSYSKRRDDLKSLSVVVAYSRGIATVAGFVIGVWLISLRGLFETALPSGIEISTSKYLTVSVALVLVSQAAPFMYLATGLNRVERALAAIYLSSAMNLLATVAATFVVGAAGPFVGITIGGAVSLVAYLHLFRELHDLQEALDPTGAKIRYLANGLFAVSVVVAGLFDSTFLDLVVSGLCTLIAIELLRRLPLREFLHVVHQAKR